MRKILDYLYYKTEYGYLLFDWVFPAIGIIMFGVIIAYLILKYVDPVTIEQYITIEIR